jgi:TetR/AcrR family acrAB operon transcriptional repressor
MARRTKEEALETRNRILDIAERVFSKRGVARTSLDDIAQAAGVTRGAIYWHFNNKADLFSAMLARVTLPLEEAAARMSDEELTDPLAKVKRCMLTALRKTATDPQCRRVFDIVCHKCEYVDEMTVVQDRYVEMRGRCLGDIERGLREAVRRGILPETVKPRIAAVGLHALVDGVISNWLLDERYFRLARDAEELVDIYVDGLRSAGSVPTAARTDNMSSRPNRHGMRRSEAGSKRSRRAGSRPSPG